MAWRRDLRSKRRRQRLYRRRHPPYRGRYRCRTRAARGRSGDGRNGGAKYQVTGVGPAVAGRNGGGDLYYADGEVWVLRLVEACKKRDGPAVTIPSPPATEMKDQIWHAIADAVSK